MAAKILIVDDTEVMRAMIRLVLEDAGYTVVAEAVNGEEAVAAFQLHRPDATTLDLNLGDISGLEVARKIQAIDPGFRFVVVTSQGQEEKIREAVEMGAKDFVIKPFQPERILQAIRGAVGA